MERLSISISDSISRPETGQRNRSALTLRVLDGITCRPGRRIATAAGAVESRGPTVQQTGEASAISNESPYRRNPADQILGNKSGPLTYRARNRAKLCEHARLRDGAQVHRTADANLVDDNLPAFSALTAGQAQGADARPPA